ncbi:LPXTG cell wall anchor domain-containing protein [Micromonospora sp. LH3U1]|uniref:LPXTG cell wall anchor domain-containing protein n=1 Tax=Micromonospora sp. LH3U1 TaxID=3018339 RepID=UPI002349060B|nr:LPXTG cell wall anchor domain-containing protein [Micromonospora sp. LH3U1]WCN81200.1 LPXTG cell wall anchor domain-containing protein [Micromonospora sp. LH3U1]
MGRTAANHLVGGALAATASLALFVSPVLTADSASARGLSVVWAEPSTDDGVTFEIVPASTPTPTPPTPTPPEPTPSHGGQLPVTGSGGSALLLAGLGGALLFVGWLAARRRRPV